MNAYDVTDTLLEHGALEDRCSPRVEVHIAAQLRPSGARSFNVVVKDISMAGFSCEAVTTMRPGARCFLALPGMESQLAEVAWNNGIIVGCSFSNLIHPTVIERIVERYRVPKPEPTVVRARTTADHIDWIKQVFAAREKGCFVGPAATRSESGWLK